MLKSLHTFVILILVALVLVPVAGAVVEPKTKTEYPDEVEVTAGGRNYTLEATGVGLREKTFMKVNVYLIVSYIDDQAELGDEPGEAIRNLDLPKRIAMHLLRGFSREKLVNSFQEVIDKNYDNTAAFAADLETFLAYWDRDAEESDELVFDYVPGAGLVTTLNGEEKGTIDNFAFVQALWTVWFGEKPVNGGLKKDLMKAIED
jgi:hypothetical protein